MNDRNIGLVLVIDQKRNCPDVSERDLARELSKEINIRETPVKNLMTKKILSVGENCTVDECMAIMTDKRVRHLPVIDSGKIIGVVSIGDVVKAVVRDHKFVIDQMTQYITGSM